MSGGPGAPAEVEPATRVDEVVELYRRWAWHRYDESVSQLDHALQTAALAERDGAPDALVAAALLHDVGHLLDLAAADGAYGERTVDLRHEHVGARYLSSLFGDEVTAPIALHVEAKRYRCGTDPSRLAELSPGSRRSLELQGGPASPEECRTLEATPGFEEALALREWDDAGKVVGLRVPPLEHFEPLLAHLTGTGRR